LICSRTSRDGRGRELAVASAVIVWLGAGHILAAITHIGPMGLVYVLSWQLTVFIGLGLAWWVNFALAASSSIVDVVTEGIALAPFVLFGLVMLVSRWPRGQCLDRLSLARRAAATDLAGARGAAASAE
jgi:hypothetical protein